MKQFILLYFPENAIYQSFMKFYRLCNYIFHNFSLSVTINVVSLVSSSNENTIKE